MSDHRPITVAIDAAAGLNNPDAVVNAVARLSLDRSHGSVGFILVGDETRIDELLFEVRHNPERIGVIHVESGESAVERACELVASGEADAVVTAGRARDAVAASLSRMKLVPGVSSAALATVFPTARTRPEEDGAAHLGLLLDVGATPTANAADLVHFGLMGEAYARNVVKLKEPRVGLLSNTTSAHHVPARVREAAAQLEAYDGLQFAGLVTGQQIPGGDLDVVVCDGFVGSVVLGLLEGVADVAVDLAREAADHGVRYRAGLRLFSKGLEKLWRVIDADEYGGAPLLGVDGVVIVAHGDSGEKALSNAIKLAVRTSHVELPTVIQAALDAATGADAADNVADPPDGAGS